MPQICLLETLGGKPTPFWSRFKITKQEIEVEVGPVVHRERVQEEGADGAISPWRLTGKKNSFWQQKHVVSVDSSCPADHSYLLLVWSTTDQI